MANEREAAILFSGYSVGRGVLIAEVLKDAPKLLNQHEKCSTRAGELLGRSLD